MSLLYVLPEIAYFLCIFKILLFNLNTHVHTLTDICVHAYGVFQEACSRFSSIEVNLLSAIKNVQNLAEC